MFQWEVPQLEKAGALTTATEIKQQPELWQETLELYQKKAQAFEDFMARLKEKHDRLRIIMTGAGTSAYVGETALPALKAAHPDGFHDFEAIATTTLVAQPEAYFSPDVPTLLISYARSGNSPESVAAVRAGQKHCKHFYQITITCAAEGKLAQQAHGDQDNVLFLMPERSNDQGFAMTGSYTCMLLTTLLLFLPAAADEKAAIVKRIAELGEEVLSRVAELEAFLGEAFSRIVYLGSGSFAGLAQEVQLKILELTAGEIATVYESSLGFRHGPKSFVNPKTVVFTFKSNDAYTRQYDLDILQELAADDVALKVVGVGAKKPEDFAGTNFNFTGEAGQLPDAYLALPLAMFGQTISLLASIQLGHEPDNPSPSGTVNRVVKGVTIHEEGE